MQVSHAIRERRSTRAFLSDQIDAETIGQIIDLAKWAPSWANAQDWNVYVVMGEPLKRIKAALERAVASGLEATPEIPFPPKEWPTYLAARMSVRRVSPEALGKRSGELGGPALFGAPCLVLLAMDSMLAPAYACFDAGLFAQTFCLAAEDRGFATCIMAMPVRFPQILHAEIPEAGDKRFVIGIAFGLSDHTAVVNRGERNRVESEELAVFVGGGETLSAG